MIQLIEISYAWDLRDWKHADPMSSIDDLIEDVILCYNRPGKISLQKK